MNKLANTFAGNDKTNIMKTNLFSPINEFSNWFFVDSASRSTFFQF